MSVEEAAARIRAQGESSRRLARDPVNQAMINNWVEAIGDTNPRYAEGIAPPAMAQVWTMNGLHGQRAADDPLGAMMAVLDEAGYTSVVATNSEQTYHRYLRVGEHVSASTALESVVGPKRTALGEGWFVTTRTSWYVGDELVADMLFRVLKFAPPPSSPGALRPVISRDTEFFWAGTKAGELRIQRWGDVLRHPPGPMPPDGDLDAKPDWLVASGRGTVYSYVVHHRPAVPGKQLPFVIALVELEEGVRMLGELVGADPAEVHIGLPVTATFLKVDDDLTLPAWRVAR
ncbi:MULTISPECIES: bifunctional MaoC family dehydratase N-terminal/OB-fold nucleic acid binding domain-containing protein [Amycolatopsis]|uniref:bifunctional MaoC family dehydratase N-terminal/OB-fold nucleic acid binding domain-containing protein n=1 Tax=Amycolatopsis TaxID=1813 RepID=UPI000B8B42E8|nr:MULTISPECIES: OB-fold domain-containing protein [Amycolatopsis]OXM64401.1 DNA-binding protein [Amycolatopsis sp. KNN50.9b]